jgi:nitric oxide reductase large subunit
MFVGLLGGAAVVYLYWRGFQITGIHARIAFFMLPFLLFGLFSGLYMNKIKKKRKLLPLIHGIGNLFLLTLAFVQIVTGWGVYMNFIR